MLYPIIRVKDNCGMHHEHIVGSNSHDVLYVDKSGGIHYLNSQNMAGTKYAGEGYSFMGVESRFSISGRPEIEFVTFDQLIDMATESLNEGMKAKIESYKVLRAYWDAEYEKCKQETGIKGDTGGMLP